MGTRIRGGKKKEGTLGGPETILPICYCPVNSV